MILPRKLNSLIDKALGRLLYPPKLESLRSKSRAQEVKIIQKEEKMDLTEDERQLLKLFKQCYPYSDLSAEIIKTPNAYFTFLSSVQLDFSTGLLYNPSSKSFIIESGFSPVRTLKAIRFLKKTIPLKKIDGLYTSIHHYPWAKTNTYHWFLECLTRLILLMEVAANSNEEIQLLLPRNLPSYQEEVLEIISSHSPPNLQLKRVASGFRYEIDRYLFVPFIAHDMFGLAPTSIVSQLSDYIIKGYSAEELTVNKYTYISRAKAKKRRIKNESELEDMLIKLGFEIHTPEDYTYAKQVQLFYQSKIVMSAHGAGLTNTLFCQQGTTVVELFPEDRIKLHYFGIAKSKGLDYHYLLGSKEDKQQDFWVNIQQANHLLSNKLRL